MVDGDTSNATIKISREYICEQCNYITYKTSNYKQHLNTNKHKKLKNATKNSSLLSCMCGKKYKHHSSYYRHKKNCNYNENGDFTPKSQGVKKEVNEEVNYKEVILTLLNQNKELQELLISQQEEFMKKQQDLLIKQQEETNKKFENLILNIKPSNNTVNKTINNNNNNNNNNKTFNIMMFLNDKCKDAMTIQEFAERLVVTIEDLEKKKFDCLSNTILKNLKSLAITERPVHCGNIKRKEWYLNHKDKGWELDNGEKLIKSAEFGINKKFQNEFIKHYPNYSTNENIKDKYMRLINRTFTDLPENEKSRLLNILSSDLLLEE